MSSIDLSLEEVLAKYTAGPDSGIFTDGGARPNPGPGAWGMVYVEDGEIVKELAGTDADTTNNRMEMTAIISALKILQPNQSVKIYADSQLCVKTLNEWAINWERNGWKKKTGPIKNLDLVQEAYSLYQSLPQVELIWLKGHDGWRWNEYADALATQAMFA